MGNILDVFESSYQKVKEWYRNKQQKALEREELRQKIQERAVAKIEKEQLEKALRGEKTLYDTVPSPVARIAINEQAKNRTEKVMKMTQNDKDLEKRLKEMLNDTWKENAREAEKVKEKERER